MIHSFWSTRHQYSTWYITDFVLPWIDAKKKKNTDQSSEHKNGTYYKAAFVEVQNVLAHKKLHISIQLMAIKWEWFGAMELKLNQTARWLQKHILWWTYSVSTKLCHKLYMKSINLATIESMNSDRMYYDVLFWNLGMNISAIHASRWRKVRLCIITASSVAGILSMWMSTIRLWAPPNWLCSLPYHLLRAQFTFQVIELVLSGMFVVLIPFRAF